VRRFGAGITSRQGLLVVFPGSLIVQLDVLLCLAVVLEYKKFGFDSALVGLVHPKPIDSCNR